jgi:hypothetical protein
MKEDQAHELIILGRNKLVDSNRILFLRPHVSPCDGMGMSKERNGVFLVFGVAGLPLEARATGY